MKKHIFVTDYLNNPNTFIYMKKYILILFTAVLFSACHHNDFTVKGVISGAGGEMLYLEANEIHRIQVLDSVKLETSGEYEFHAKAPEYPEFYRLRLKNSYINFSIDSTETIIINAQEPGFTSNYKVEGSDNSEKIRIIALAGQELKKYVDKYNEQIKNPENNSQLLAQQLLEKVQNYKKEILPLIYENPRSTAAYFAIFQQINGQDIFDPYNKEDSKAIRAVATQYDFYYKNSVRAKQLHNMAIEALKMARIAEKGNTIKIDTIASVIDISLPDIYGKKQTLSSLKGKVVLLDFTAYQTEYSPQYNLLLAEIYRKYKQQGVEIYQISLDNDDNFWKVSASNLPWICVRDANSLNSRIAATYNVQQLPTAYLLDRTGAIRTRLTSMKEIENEIKKLL